MRQSALLLFVAALPLGAQTKSDTTTAPPPIEDNSFLVEEAYNQERGVVQHISTFAHATAGRAWMYAFTQEWPVPNQTHQLSYSVPVLHGTSTHVGDVALNYRWQARDRDGVLIAPRLTLLLPTGNANDGSGAGGVGYQVNLPLTWELTPRLVTHSNIGGTLVPNGGPDGLDTRIRNVTLGQSVIFLARPTLNFMLEALHSRTSVSVKSKNVIDLGDEIHDNNVTISPGLRWAYNMPSGLQIVPGLAVPITLRRDNGSTTSDKSVFVYLSFEHSFHKE